MLLTFWHAVESVLTIIIMFMTGWALTRAGWFDEKTSLVFSRIILNVSLPCYMLWNLMSNFDRARLTELSGGLIVPVLSIGGTYLLGVLTSNLMRVDRRRKGVFRSVFFTSNTIFVGLAVNLSLFGAESVPYVLVYYIANTCFFWTLGTYEIGRNGEESPARFSPGTLKRAANPALLGFFAAVLLILLRVRLPAFVMDGCKYIGELTTPLAMFFIGIVLYSTPLKKLRIDRDIAVLILARFVICPASVLLLTRLIPLPELMTKVFVIQSAMPAMTSTGVVARQYGGDYEFATVVTVITTVLSMVFIPVYMILL